MLHVKALQVSFGSQSVLHNISFGLTNGEVLAITGANGAGKSTLLKCITGIMAPTAGEIQRQRGLNFVYLPQNTPDSNQSVIEFLLSDFADIYHNYQKIYCGDSETIEYANAITEYIEVGGYEMEAKLQRLIESFAFSENDLFKSLHCFSEGQKRIFALLRLFLTEAQLFILDEPTNHLDIESLEVLDQLLEDFPGGMLFINHDRQFIAKNARTIFSFKSSMLVPVEF